jgi:2-aminophenol/2-amino-5-chlorophenol 1,6-dioxygenase alpha subunit
MAIRRAFERAREAMLAWKPDLLLLYSTMWPSVIGHQVIADPRPRWVHVDELFHDLGSIPYEFVVDAEFAHACVARMRERGLAARTVAYHGFPIDTGAVVALKLLVPDGAVPACVVSSNVYSDRAETLVLGKACRDAIDATGRRAAVVAVSTLSNRLFTDWISPDDDRIHSQKDDEWNRKILEFLAAGRLEDVAQLSRVIHRQIRIRKVVNFKPAWWMSAVMGQHNHYRGAVLGYAAIHGTGAAVVTLEPSAAGVGDKEYDEEDVELYRGDRDVLDDAAPARALTVPAAAAGAPRVAGRRPSTRGASGAR